jgi:hypothetical protein
VADDALKRKLTIESRMAAVASQRKGNAGSLKKIIDLEAQGHGSL